MIKNFEAIHDQLQKLAPIINSFKSEAVQLRIVELVLKADATSDPSPDRDKDAAAEKASAAGTRQPARAAAKRADTSKRERKATAKTGRPGPGAMIETLIGEGFFKKAKGASDIVNHCKNDKVLTYNNTEISVSLGRAVKAGKLKREKNADGNFTYYQP